VLSDMDVKEEISGLGKNLIADGANGIGDLTVLEKLLLDKLGETT